MGQNQNVRETTITSHSVLDAVNEINGGTLSEIAEHMDLPASTLYTHLQTLIKTEHISKVGNQYHLGMKLFYLGERARMRDKRYELARQTVVKISDKLPEEITFCVEEYGRSIALFNKTNTLNQEGSQLGKYFHMHSSASGKAILSEYSDTRISEVIDRHGLPQLTESTITDSEELFTELRDIRELGYAVNQGEAKNGLNAVGMVVRNPDETVFGALCIIAPSYRMSNYEEVANSIKPFRDELEELIMTQT